jgi:hypothetical protein
MARDNEDRGKDALSEFGLDLTVWVRDDTFSWIENLIEGSGRTPNDRRLHQQVSASPETAEAARNLARWATDLCVHNFLRFLEQSERFDLVVIDDDRAMSIRDASDGLSGELYTEDGWFARFSKYGGPVAYTDDSSQT